MRITALHINGFGKLVNYDCAFESGLNVMEYPNGYGKTTLASFIQAMFYGLGSTRKQSLDDNPGKKFQPWTTNTFGGTLSFEYEGGEYRIERDFAKNVLVVYDCKTGRRTTAFGDCPGRIIFGLDREAFAAVTYMPQDLPMPKANDSLSARLSQLSNNDGKNSFERAIDNLEKKSKEYVKTGARGKIDILKREIGDSELELDRLKREYDKLYSQEADLRIKKADLEGCNHRIMLISQASQVRYEERLQSELTNKIKQAEDSVRQGEEFKKRLLEIDSDLAKTEAEMSRRQSIYDKQLKNRQNYEMYRLFDDKEKRVLQLRKQLADIKRSYTRLPDKEELEAVNAKKRTLWKKGEDIVGCNEQIKALTQQSAARFPPTKPKYVCLVLAIVFLAVAIGAFAFGAVLPEIVYWAALAVGGVGFVVTLVVYLGKITKYYGAKSDYDNGMQSDELQIKLLADRRNKLNVEYETLKQEISADFSQFGVRSDGEDVEELTIRITADTDRIRDFTEQLACATADYDEFIKHVDVGELRLCKDYTPEADNGNTVEMRKCFEKKDALSSEKARLTEKLKNVIDLREQESLNKQWKECTERLDDYRERYEVDEYAEVDLEAAAEREQAMQKRLNDEVIGIEAGIKHAKNSLPDLAERENALNAKSRELAECKFNYDCITLAIECMKKASDSISGNYLPLLRKYMNGYLDTLCGKDRRAQTLTLTGDWDLTVNESGGEREFGYFSAGTKDLYNFILRLSLMNSVYALKKGDNSKLAPVLIIDDSFTNLDGNRFDAVSKLLKGLKGTQILYFTCYRKIDGDSYKQ